MQKSIIRQLNSRGDATVAEWTPGVKAEEQAAGQTFDMLTQQGWLMFNATDVAVPEGPVRTFDPKAREYVAVRPIAGG